MIFTNYPRNTVELTGRRPLSISRSRSWPLLSRSLGPCILTTTNTNREGNFSPVTGHTLSPANITPQSTLRTLRTVDTTMCTQYHDQEGYAKRRSQIHNHPLPVQSLLFDSALQARHSGSQHPHADGTCSVAPAMAIAEIS